jgi:hypothetical protein
VGLVDKAEGKFQSSTRQKTNDGFEQAEPESFLGQSPNKSVGYCFASADQSGCRNVPDFLAMPIRFILQFA